MAHSLSFTPVTTTVSNPTKPGILIGNTNTIIKVVKVHEGLPNFVNNARFQSLEAKAKVAIRSVTVDKVTCNFAKRGHIFHGNENKLRKSTEGYYPSPATKPRSIVCAECDGNGAKVCGQCEGYGVNSQDHFNGQFKAGGLCWLCRGKKEVLCGNCNGAGFIGGFMSTFDE